MADRCCNLCLLYSSNATKVVSHLALTPVISMIRAMKFVILILVAVPIAVIAAGLLWFGTILAAYNYKWGWLEVPVHYRLTFGVEVGGVPTPVRLSCRFFISIFRTGRYW